MALKVTFCLRVCLRVEMRGAPGTVAAAVVVVLSSLWSVQMKLGHATLCANNAQKCELGFVSWDCVKISVPFHSNRICVQIICLTYYDILEKQYSRWSRPKSWSPKSWSPFKTFYDLSSMLSASLKMIIRMCELNPPLQCLQLSHLLRHFCVCASSWMMEEIRKCSAGCHPKAPVFVRRCGFSMFHPLNHGKSW